MQNDWLLEILVAQRQEELRRHAAIGRHRGRHPGEAASRARGSRALARRGLDLALRVLRKSDHRLLPPARLAWPRTSPVCEERDG